jgi:hypothetical protein
MTSARFRYAPVPREVSQWPHLRPPVRFVEHKSRWADRFRLAWQALVLVLVALAIGIFAATVWLSI